MYNLINPNGYNKPTCFQMLYNQWLHQGFLWNLYSHEWYAKHQLNIYGNGIRWIEDEERDIGLSFFNIIVFIKYKHSFIIEWFKSYPNAPKYIKE